MIEQTQNQPKAEKRPDIIKTPLFGIPMGVPITNPDGTHSIEVYKKGRKERVSLDWYITEVTKKKRFS